MPQEPPLQPSIEQPPEEDRPLACFGGKSVVEFYEGLTRTQAILLLNTIPIQDIVAFVGAEELLKEIPADITQSFKVP